MSNHSDHSCHSDHGQAPLSHASSEGCCGSKPVASPDPSSHSHDHADGCCGGAEAKSSIDWILWICLPLVVMSYGLHLVLPSDSSMPIWLSTFVHTSFEMVNAMWWGILTAAFFVGLLGRIPRELVMSVLGRAGSKQGVFRATLAGLLLDLCNHGILMIGMKLYERGASIGQVMAFLIASPWNSFTLTLILVGLIGLPWTLTFIAGSLIIAWLSGWLFDLFVSKQVLPANPNHIAHTQIAFWPSLKQTLSQNDWSASALVEMFWIGLKESKSVLRWVVLGGVLVALIRAFVPDDNFELWFGATLSGLFLTLLASTVIEVCSEGSSPIAADLMNRAHAPGNAFTFLMAGAATDYTEIMSVKETTRSWKIALFLPLVTIPQVLILGWVMNHF